MNGRVYDPIIGRFLSADPIIQAPYNSQSYNRYSYVWNNPLSAVDPSGFVRERWGVKSSGSGMQGLAFGTGSYDSGWVSWKDTFGLKVTVTLSNGTQISVPLSDLPYDMQASIVNSGYSVSSEVANAIAGSYFSNNMSTATLTNSPQWVMPEGGSHDMNESPAVMTNGIMGSLADFIRLVNDSGIPGFFNPSNGLIADFGESFMQKFFGGSGDALAAAFAAGLAGVDHPMTIIAHSQGTLTVANAALYFGLPKGSTFIFRSPALSRSSAQAAAQFNGGTLQYDQPWGDAANIWSGNPRPLRILSGFADFLCGFCIHSANGL